MPAWTCPNPKCTNDQELQLGQRCPLCGRAAKEFTFTKLGNLLKEKWSAKKARERNKEAERILERSKYCPTCGSTNIFWASGLPQLWSVWECRECGYKGAVVLENGKLAAKLQEEWNERDRQESEKKED